jgi:DNA mismatch repair ATPase MutL
LNVHPVKMEVRFQDSRRLDSQLPETVRMRFLIEQSDRTDATVAEATASTQPDTGRPPLPHRRPMTLVFTREGLDRPFKQT